MTWRASTTDPGFENAFASFLADAAATTVDVAPAVHAIIEAVRARGDAALCEYTARFDRLTLSPEQLRVGTDEIEAASAGIPRDLAAALDLAATRIETFHRAQMPADLRLDDAVGLALGMRWGAIDSVGLYVPGGTAAYPSSVLMNAIPARIAGVRRLAMCVPTPDGVLNPLVLAAARRAGVSEIFRIGGAQAIAALAHGTQRVGRVDRIVGPGNRYVAEAKRQVFGLVGIDSVAGPSDVTIIAADGADADWIAIDLLAQSEHDEASQSILVTPSPDLANAVAARVATLLPTLARHAIAGGAWARQGAVVVVRDLDEAAALANRIAPEHLQIVTADPRAVFAMIRHAGSVFLGPHAPTALGDYVAGPNHVLPTGGSARFSSGLSVFDFLKRTTWTEASAAGARAIAGAAMALAHTEGLQGHALSLARRLA